MSDIFISYGREDQDLAERIARDLERSGLRVFHSKHLLPGEEWGPRLMREIERARYVLVLLSPSFFQSPWARRELETAASSEAEGGGADSSGPCSGD